MRKKTDKPRVQINYKSGISMVFECDNFKLTRGGPTGQLSVEWTDAEPRPLLIGVDDIESVWELT